jgi:hypothetical protein
MLGTPDPLCFEYLPAVLPFYCSFQDLRATANQEVGRPRSRSKITGVTHNEGDRQQQFISPPWHEKSSAMSIDPFFLSLCDNVVKNLPGFSLRGAIVVSDATPYIWLYESFTT